MSLSLPVKLPSGNAWTYRPWYYERAWKQRFLKELPPLTKGKWAKGKMRVTITRILGPREREYDHDNLYAGCKPLLDALKVMHYIVDDTPKMITLNVAQDARTRDAGPVILVSIRRGGKG